MTPDRGALLVLDLKNVVVALRAELAQVKHQNLNLEQTIKLLEHQVAQFVERHFDSEALQRQVDLQQRLATASADVVEAARAYVVDRSAARASNAPYQALQAALKALEQAQPA